MSKMSTRKYSEILQTMIQLTCILREGTESEKKMILDVIKEIKEMNVMDEFTLEKKINDQDDPWEIHVIDIEQKTSDKEELVKTKIMLPLIELLKKEVCPDAKCKIIDSIEGAAITPALSQLAIESLRMMMEDKHVEVRKAALKAIELIIADWEAMGYELEQLLIRYQMEKTFDSIRRAMMN